MGDGALNSVPSRQAAVRWHLSSDSSHKLVGKCIVVGAYYDTPWRIIHFNPTQKTFTAATMTVPSRAHYVTLDDLRAGYVEGLIKIQES